MKILVVRHGESDMNVAGICQGPTTKSHLTLLGKEQAVKLADKLSSEKIDLAFISSLDRAEESAEIILQYHPETKVEFVGELEERDTGEYAGRPATEIREAWQTSGLPFGEFQPEGGESWYQAGERVVSFVETLVRKYKRSDLTILLVGHGSILTYLFMWADKFDPKDTNKEKYDYYHPANMAVGAIEINDEGEPVLLSINDTSHLEK